MNPHEKFDIRCPVHGFIPFDDWERQVIEKPAFQRLRRIRQLAWTDQVYPGAMHTRFEHSLGVMHTAESIFNAIVRNSGKVLHDELGYDEQAVKRNLRLVRFAALLHDVGHSPFSHASEDLFPDQEDGKKYAHEQYSAAIVRGPLRQAIEEHQLNQGHNLSADDVAALIEGSAGQRQGIFWRDLITGQLDADRIDYLLRDSHHAGVHYGRFDHHRLISTMTAMRVKKGLPRIGVQDGGWHAAEALVIARYFMFTQVYFHKTRVAYDVHLRGAMKELLPGGQFPTPDRLEDFLSWDDWRVVGMLAAGEGGEHGRRLAARQHYRVVYRTNEVREPADEARLASARTALGPLLAAEMPARKSWYKTGHTDIRIEGPQGEEPVPLSVRSNVVRNIGTNDQVLLYCSPESKSEARQKVKEALNGLE